MKKWFKALTLLILLGLALSACGSAATAAPEAAVEEAPAEDMAEPAMESAVDEAAADTGTNLTLWIYDDGRLEILKELGDIFKEEYGVGLTVELVELDEIKNAMTLGASSGEGPDMAIIPHDNLGALVENSAVTTIDLGDKEQDYLPAAVDGFMYNGELYGLPLAVENIGFFRNTDMVPEAPATWVEVAQIGTDLVNSGQAESAIGLPDLTYNSYPIYTNLWRIHFWQGC